MRFFEKAREKFGNRFSYEKSKYLNSQKKLLITCRIHGDVEVSPASFLSSKFGCPKCGIAARGESKRKGNAEIIKRLIEIHGNTYDFSKVTTDKRHDTVEILCKKHGWVKTDLGNLLKGQRGCVSCRGENIALAKNGMAALKKAIANRSSNYEYDIETFKNYLTPMRIVCQSHGEFWQTPGNHFHQEQNCPACANTCSKGESELFDFVLSLGVEAEKRNRKIIPPYELDVFIPSRNIAIEYHGLHWHADDMGGTSLKTKWQLCQEKGIRLIQIFEDEWLTRRHVVEDLLRASLGLREVKNARTLTTKIITKEEAKSFLEQWHIAGYARSELHFALCDEENIVSVLTTAKPRFGNEDLEIVRFASSCHVRGGFRKLFSLALETTNPQSVVSFADLRFGTGNTYADAGFNDMGITQADYWWFKGQERLTRYKTQKHRLKVDKRFSEFYKDDLTEREICTAAGYRKITGIGHRKFIWNRN